MRSILAILALTTGSLLYSGLSALLCALLCMPRYKLLSTVAIACVPAFCMMLPALAMYLVARIGDRRMHRILAFAGLLIAFATVILAGALSSFVCREVLDYRIPNASFQFGIVVGTLYAAIGLWQARKAVFVLFATSQDKERQPNQALQTTSVTRSGFGKVSVPDRQRRGV